MFEFLFNYRPVVFERGELLLALPLWVYALSLLGVGAAVPFALRYRDIGPTVTTRDRWVLGALRAGAIGVLLFALFQPVLLVSTVVPRRNYVAVLLDDSRSMRIADEGGAPRANRVIEMFGGAGADTLAGVDEAGALRRALEDRFRLRMYSFDSDAVRVDAPETMTFAGETTSLPAALDRVRQEMEGLPVSGVVVLSDGADNADEPIAETLLALQADGLPVHTIGLGAERIVPDVEVRRVELPRRALEGTTMVADVILSHAGLAGRTVRLDVEDDGRIVGSQQVELGVDGEIPAQLQFTLEESGPRRLTFAVQPVEGEAVTENNRREALLEVGDERRKILYFEGQVRPEIGYTLRAVKDDENLQVVTLTRTATEKFFRQNVDGPDELPGGFPGTREELYRYSGLILGSVEASFFTHDQLQMIADFVGQRGGGLLVLGGHLALAEGGYAGTPLADALPVVLETGGSEPLAEILPELTPAGRRHPAIRLTGDSETSADRWGTLPPLTSVNVVTSVKPGAVTLLEGVPLAGGDDRVLLAYQRYGRGTSIVFNAQDLWMWQMHADIPLEDETHETLWRQLLRWLIHDTPGRARLDLIEDAAAINQPMTIRAEIEDARHLRVNGADVSATVTGPSGVAHEVPLEWTVERDGEYEGRFTPDEPGLYEVEVTAASRGGDAARLVGEGMASTGVAGDSVAATGYFRAGPQQREQFAAGRRTELLRRISEETGGRSYSYDDAGLLAEEIQYTESGDTLQEERPLWNMPILFIAMGLLLTAEWTYRRRRDLA
ncbi:MAG: hypothetical protein R3195_09355 [Gemmatimonadota bacterium]|nr:hypothetical protein [Gemmatimonadota bacterium]